jgi:hypothetical protein
LGGQDRVEKNTSFFMKRVFPLPFLLLNLVAAGHARVEGEAVRAERVLENASDCTLKNTSMLS